MRERVGVARLLSGEQLRRARVQHGLSLRELAARTGRAKSYGRLGELERGVAHHVRVDFAESIARELNRKTSTLFHVPKGLRK